ncbi:hypothetical protein H4582DRAFT_2129000 [Lactarius indigo]|nr:hypothetical protein H4582DRAFT_2129000 [Lactarius indigo]
MSGTSVWGEEDKSVTGGPTQETRAKKEILFSTVVQALAWKSKFSQLYIVKAVRLGRRKSEKWKWKQAARGDAETARDQEGDSPAIRWCLGWPPGAMATERIAPAAPRVALDVLLEDEERDVMGQDAAGGGVAKITGGSESKRGDSKYIGLQGGCPQAQSMGQATGKPYPLIAIITMASNLQASSSSAPNFQPIFEKALEEYKKKTGEDLTAHPLAAEIKACNSESPDAILTVLERKADELNETRSGDDRLTKWLNPTVNILNALSATLGEGAGSVFPPTKIIFSGISILLVAAKSTVASREVLAELFDGIESFFRRLKTYTEGPLTQAAIDVLAKIMAEVLSILAIATKGVKEKRASGSISSDDLNLA